MCACNFSHHPHFQHFIFISYHFITNNSNNNNNLCHYKTKTHTQILHVNTFKHILRAKLPKITLQKKYLVYNKNRQL